MYRPRFGKYLMLFVMAVVLSVPRAAGMSLSLDSIAEMGKFPKFCVDVYRWGDKFFNTYDTTYVKGTGYKFNIKAKADTWGDRYWFNLPDDYEMHMRSDPCTSVGLHLTYLAVSVGYDINVSKIFGSHERARNRFTFGFNCALFSAELNWVTNNVATRIRQFGPRGDMQDYNIRFDGINTNMFSVSAYYFLNNKRYSIASAFNYSKIQRKHQGSFFFGFNYWTQSFGFDFSGLPNNIRNQLPYSWADFDYKYKASNHNYALVAGYAYNWVFFKDFVFGVSEAPNVGLKRGYINYNEKEKYSFSLFNRARAALVWNKNHWFVGGVLKVDNSLIYDKDHSIINTVINGELSAGYRFNIW